MKKLPILCLLIAVMLVACIPTIAFAEDEPTTPDPATPEPVTPPAVSVQNDNVCLIHPVAIATIGNYIFIADNHAADKSVILCFDVSGANIVDKKISLKLNTPVVNISNVNGKLCVMLENSVQFYNVPTGSETALTLDKTYSIAGAKDFTYGKVKSNIGGSDLQTEIYIGKNLCYRVNENDWWYFGDGIEAAAPSACKYINEYNYFVFDGKCQRYNGVSVDNKFNTKLKFATGFTPTGIVEYTLGGTNALALFNNERVYIIEEKTDEFVADRELIVHNGAGIVDVEYGCNKLFVLNSNNQIEIYNKSEDNAFVLDENVQIGTETVTYKDAPPTQFTSFTLAKTKGYPTNIIYKTTDEQSTIAKIITPDSDNIPEDFIILGFDGAEEFPYYYVLVGNKFGWIKKSDDATTPEQDVNGIEIIDNRVSTDDTTYKFNSFNGVFIYTLPLGESQSISLTQTIKNPRPCVLLQKFVEKSGDKVTDWYYVEYGEEVDEGEEPILKYGFVRADNINQWSMEYTPDESATILGDRKINSTLRQAVILYATSERLDGQEIYKDGRPVKLYSGDIVKAIRTEGDSTLIQILSKDGGVPTMGWVNSKNLIGVHKITTNALVGICILSVAIVLTVVLTVVLVKRKKNKNAQPVEETDDEEE